MLTDFNGCDPEWWQWAVSGAMVIGGIIMTATGVGGALGGALICSGVNSIIGSYTNESNGGSTTAGWIGGALTGLAAGYGAGMGGTMLLQATEASGAACLGLIAKSLIISYGTGYVGSCAGQALTAMYDRKQLVLDEICFNAALTGAVNLYAGIGAGMSSALMGLPTTTETTAAVASFLSTGCALLAEAFCDTVSVVGGLIG